MSAPRRLGCSRPSACHRHRLAPPVAGRALLGAVRVVLRGAGLALLVAVLPAGPASLTGCAQGLERMPIVIGGEGFSVEVARTEEQKRTGLMHRKSLGPREGMIFVYDRDQQMAFWMKNTSIPLTLVFLSREGVILQIEDLKPHSLKTVVSERAARYALELPQGVLAELGVRAGDTIEVPPGLK